ncbi:sugar ABC transporter permease [Nocardia stercoris]|uniref:Sugar ABC transporter permease n=1 Tax=Nocardia stercoris TaxID=2483361 RepID=A0A3M2KVM4_9NOCA|nr:sugar ABC transporter permease [Nocardia stercoris]RMI28500.1 sugar ABC transporter permease [Nocardia stercoris]
MTGSTSALERMLDRISSTESAVRDRFPLFAAADSGEWTTSRRGSWAGGFWVGQLWLRARVTDDPRHRAAAETWAQRLEPAIAADTVTRGLTLWYGVAAGHRLGLSVTAGQQARAGAARLAATFDAAAGILPWGTAFGEPAEPLIARVDGLAGTIPLLAWAGAAHVATRHLATHLRICAAPTGLIPALSRSGAAWEPRGEPPAGWSRGEAWLLLALADAAQWLDGDHACLADELLDRWPWPISEIPAALRQHPEVPDTSAAAITAVALCKLGRPDRAQELVDVLVAHHLSAGDRPGRLLSGCYDLPRGLATTHELIWGDFFLMLALAILSGAVDPTDL